MTSKWRIDGVFWTCALTKWRQVFTRVGLLVDPYSVLWVSFGNSGLMYVMFSLNEKIKINAFGNLDQIIG